MMRGSIASVAVLVVVLAPGPSSESASQLAPTPHPPVGGSLDDLWLVPSEEDRIAAARAMYAPLADGIEAYGAGDYAKALSLVDRPALARSGLRDYASYYKGLAQLKLSRSADARATFDGILERNPEGYLRVAAALGAGEAAEALGDTRRALTIYESLAASETTVDPDVLSRIGRTALVAGDKKKAAEAYVRVYYEYPLSDQAIEASTALESLDGIVVRPAVDADLARAARLFGARRYTDARRAYVVLRDRVHGEKRELVELRIAQCDYFQGRYKAAVQALTPLLTRGEHEAEARFYHLSALRELGQHDEYVSRTRALVDRFPDSSWAQEALDKLGTHYILTNDDAKAAEVFRELFDLFPTGTRGERAAWKAGWWAYKNGDYQDTIRYFEAAARTYPRSNYRPSWLYWAGRAHARLGAAAEAESRLRLVFTDYGSSYYGRLAVRRLPQHARIAAAADVMPAAGGALADGESLPPTAPLIQDLLSAGLYDDAINELRFAERSWGSTRVTQATLAWAYNRKGELRRAITLMRRAYPQFLTATGHELPTEILEIIFPLTYWDLIRKHAKARKLDPYLVAALIAQESTFDPKARSVANAWGLMQIVPATGRRLARSLGIRPFRTSMLTDPEINIRLGTYYFAGLVERFGGTHFALASYNAGESRVVRWKAERPGLDEDEFIDDIPFPETQNYVKRILGTAEDYRSLYEEKGGRPIPVAGSVRASR